RSRASRGPHGGLQPRQQRERRDPTDRRGGRDHGEPESFAHSSADAREPPCRRTSGCTRNVWSEHHRCMSWIRGNGSLAIPARRRRLGPAMLAQYSERINPSLNSWVADKAISFRNISVYKILRDLPEASFSSILEHTIVTPDTPLANTARLTACDGDHAQGGPLGAFLSSLGRSAAHRRSAHIPEDCR